MELKFDKDVIELCERVFEGFDEGVHAWIRCGDAWITIEPCEEEDRYLCVYLVRDIDALGYPFSCVIDDAYLTESDVKSMKLKLEE